MPHDKKGNELRAGDTVLVRCKVKAVHLTEEFCNVDLSVRGLSSDDRHYQRAVSEFMADDADERAGGVWVKIAGDLHTRRPDSEGASSAPGTPGPILDGNG